MIDLTPQEKFYKDGMVPIAINSFKCHADLLSLLKQINSKIIKKNFRLESKKKYFVNGRPTAFDLMPNEPLPNDALYDDLYSDFLKQGLMEEMEFISGRNLSLLSIRTRIVMKGSNSKGATAAHRDGHFYGGKKKYVVPPPINLHFYPSFDDQPSDQFKYWTSTNRFQPDNRLIDRAITTFGKRQTVKSSNDYAYMVDTAGIHKACAPTDERSSFRLMYSFIIKQ